MKCWLRRWKKEVKDVEHARGDSTLDDAVSMDYILSLKFCKHCLIGLPAISTTLLIDVVAFCWNFLLAISSGSIRLASTMPECYQILICFRPSSVPSSLSTGQSAGCATEGAPKAPSLMAGVVQTE